MRNHATGHDAADLTRELLALYRHGLRSANPPATPSVRQLLHVPIDLNENQSLPTIRNSVMNAASGLPPELRRAFYESSGARRGSPARRTQRLRDAAQREQVSERTIQRRAEEEAIPLIVAHLLDHNSRVVEASRFTVTRLHLRLDLSLPQPVLCQERTIQASVPHMEGFYEEFTFPRLHDGQPTWRELGGCSIEHVSALNEGMWGISYSFPDPLWQGETHTFSVAMRLPDHSSLLPEIRLRPSNHTYSSIVDIRFGAQLPSRVESFETTAVLDIVPDKDIRRRLRPDRRDQRFEFETIRLGNTAGVRWFMDD